jgi:hypothetical protein
MGKIRSLVVATIFFLMAGTICAHAETEKQAAVKELIKVTNLAELMEKTTIDTLKFSLAERFSQHPNIPEDVQQKTFKILKETFQENMDGLLVPMSKVYEQNFSLKEINQLIDFYKTDVGQKVINTMPKVMQEGMIIGARWGQQVGLIAMERIQKELASKGYKI